MMAPNKKELLSRLEYCTNLPTPPRVAIRIIELNQNPDVNINDVVNVIKLDPAISAKLIRMANSPIYAKQRETKNLRQAIIQFGSYNALTLALSFSVVRSLNGDTDNRLDYSLFWRRSLASAIACQLLGQLFTNGKDSEFFLSGLIQDIGMLALDRISPDIYQDADPLQSSHEVLWQYERNRIDTDHAEVGAWLIDHWGFPSSLVNAIKGSHNPLSDTIDPDYLMLAKTVSLASNMADLLCNENHKKNISHIISRAQELLAIDKDMVLSILDTIISEIKPMADLYEIDVSDKQYLETINDQAKEILMLRSMKSINEAKDLKIINASLKNHTVTLEEEKRRDHLTQLFNRQHLDKTIIDEFISAEENGWPLSLAFIDIDYFKVINDEHGHQAGDECLKHTANVLIQETRGRDTIFRYGGEEIVILLPGTNNEGTHIVCDRILTAFRKKPCFISTDLNIPFTVSIGVATQNESSVFKEADDLLRAADKALYAAKFGGRNRAIFYGEDSS